MRSSYKMVHSILSLVDLETLHYFLKIDDNFFISVHNTFLHFGEFTNNRRRGDCLQELTV